MKDVVGLTLTEAEALLKAAGIGFAAERTRPTRDYFKVDEDALYVIRQKVRADGLYQLTAAAKLRKEVC